MDFTKPALGVNMTEKRKERIICYRCPDCGTATLGVAGDFARGGSIIRLKCSCENAPTLDLTLATDDKVKISVPCLLCKDSHTYIIPRQSYLLRDEINLSCPFSGQDILHIGSEEAVQKNLKRTGEELQRLLTAFDAEELSDIQPSEVDEGDILPDPAVYDTLRFLIKDLEADGKIKCLCNEGEYDLRYCEGGVECYCVNCGAKHLFRAMTQTMAEEYLSLDEITLT